MKTFHHHREIARVIKPFVHCMVIWFRIWLPGKTDRFYKPKWPGQYRTFPTKYAISSHLLFDQIFLHLNKHRTNEMYTWDSKHSFYIWEPGKSLIKKQKSGYCSRLAAQALGTGQAGYLLIVWPPCPVLRILCWMSKYFSWWVAEKRDLPPWPLHLECVSLQANKHWVSDMMNMTVVPGSSVVKSDLSTLSIALFLSSFLSLFSPPLSIMQDLILIHSVGGWKSERQKNK